MHTHSQNLNDRPDGSTGTILAHGRAWLHTEIGRRATFGVSWLAGWRHIGVELTVGDEESDLHVHLGLGPFAALGVLALLWGGHFIWAALLLPFAIWTVWFNVEALVPYDALAFGRFEYGRMAGKPRREGRTISLQWHHGALWWTLWMDQDVWSSTDPKWRRGSFNPVDFLLGRHEFSRTEIETRSVRVPMPEGDYEATGMLELATWTRPRSPFTKRLTRATVEVETGIPHPGKGTASYNCGEDRMYSITTPARTIEEGVEKFVAAVLDKRKRYPL